MDIGDWVLHRKGYCFQVVGGEKGGRVLCQTTDSAQSWLITNQLTVISKEVADVIKAIKERG